MAELADRSFGALLRRLRIVAGLSQEELADAARLGSRTVSDLERGVAKTARRETARSLAAALELTGPDLERFLALARGEPDDEIVPGVAGESSGAVDAMRALPRDVEVFGGRDQELARLGLSRGDDVVGIRAISGMAGVGKTALAIHLAHQLSPKFPDGQLFLCLHGHTPDRRPISPHDALASLLLTLGVGAGAIPGDSEARAALWRSRAAGKQLLLVLDDAKSTEQVRPLLPGTPGSLVVVTSRRRLTALEDDGSISLGVLPEPDAMAMFVRLAGRPELQADDHSVSTIVELCGRLPLAVGMAARQLHHHPAWSAADLEADLAESRGRNELLRAESVSVAAAFDLSYAELSTDEQHLFRRLGLHPGPDVDAAAAAALDGTDLGTARRHLERLYDHHLIEQPSRGRYRLHDLLREHARSLVVDDPATDPRAASARLFEYYERVASLARRCSSAPSRGSDVDDGALDSAPAFTEPVGAISWLRAERANLTACREQAVAQGDHQRVVSLTLCLAEQLWLDGPWADAIRLHGEALRAARLCDDRAGEAAVLDELANIQFVMGDVDAAAKSYSEALEIYRAIDDQRGEASALNALGQLQCMTDDVATAEVTLEESIAMFRACGDHMGEARALRNLAAVRFERDDYGAAGTSLEESLSICREVGSRQSEALSLYLLGEVLERRGDYDGAARAQLRALDLFSELDDRTSRGSVLASYATVRADLGDLEEAERLLLQALEIHDAFGFSRAQATALFRLAEVRSRAGDLEAALEGFEEARRLLEDMNDGLAVAQTLNEIGSLRLRMGDVAAAIECHRAAIAGAASGGPWLAAMSLAGLGRCELALGDRERGLAKLAEARDVLERLGAAQAGALTEELTQVEH